MDAEEIEARAEHARALFKEGFNCSQAVVASCADLFDIPQPLALRLGASFGAGIGRMRQTCGAFCGIALLEGLRSGSVEGVNQDQKKLNYAHVQALAQKFKDVNGSINCGELLGLSTSHIEPTPAPRDETYYKKRPCPDIVFSATKLFLETLNRDEF